MQIGILIKSGNLLEGESKKKFDFKSNFFDTLTFFVFRFAAYPKKMEKLSLFTFGEEENRLEVKNIIFYYWLKFSNEKISFRKKNFFFRSTENFSVRKLFWCKIFGSRKFGIGSEQRKWVLIKGPGIVEDPRWRISTSLESALIPQKLTKRYKLVSLAFKEDPTKLGLDKRN